MLKITRAANGEVVFNLSGRMGAENVGELETLITAEVSARRIVLDLKDLTMVDQDVVRFLGRCEVDSIELKNCPAYIREWITRERTWLGEMQFFRKINMMSRAVSPSEDIRSIFPRARQPNPLPRHCSLLSHPEAVRQ